MSLALGLEQMLSSFLEHKINAEELKQALQLLKPPTPLAVRSLSLCLIEEMLGLTRDDDNEFDSVGPIPIPHDLKLWLEKSDRTNDAGEAKIRCKLNLLLLCAHDLVSSSSTNSRPLNVRMERTWANSPIHYKGKTWMLTGQPDYGVWYGEEQNIDLGAVIMEPKRLIRGQSLPEALAYMGCVHKQRKHLGKTDTTVYGICMNEIFYKFIKLDNESRWSYTSVGVVGNGFEQVLGLLVHLMKEAASMPPTSNQQESEVSELIFNYELDIEDEIEDLF